MYLCPRGTRSPPVVVHPRTGDLSPSQANTAKGLPDRHLPGKGEPAVPAGRAARAFDLRKRLRQRAGAAPRATAGLRQPHHEAPSPGKHGDSLPLLPAVPAPPAIRPRITAATELNPHKYRIEPPWGSPRRLAAPGQIRSGASAYRP